MVQVHSYPMVLPSAVVLADSNLHLSHVHFMGHVARAQVGGQHVLQLVLALIVAAAVHDGCLQPAGTAGVSAVYTCWMGRWQRDCCFQSGVQLLLILTNIVQLPSMMAACSLNRLQRRLMLQLRLALGQGKSLEMTPQGMSSRMNLTTNNAARGVWAAAVNMLLRHTDGSQKHHQLLERCSNEAALAMRSAGRRDPPVN